MNTDHGATVADGLNYAVKVGPPLGVTGTSLMGLPLSEWVYITTIIYTLLQTGYFIWKLVHKEKEKLIAEVKEAKSHGSE